MATPAAVETIVELPQKVARALNDFCRTKKSGTVQLDIIQGEVQQVRLTESVRVDKRSQ